MRYFGQRRPRGFHHNFIYVDERAELLRRLAGGIGHDAGRGAGRGVDRDAHARRGFTFRQAAPGRRPCALASRAALAAALAVMLVALAVMLLAL